MEGHFEAINHIYLNARMELLKHLRKRRLAVLIAISILMPLVYYVLPGVMGKDISNDPDSLMNMNLGFMNMLVIISASVFIGDSISGEFQSKTGLILFPTPQRRTSVLIGKFISGIIATCSVIATYYLVTCLEVSLVYGFDSLDMNIVKSFLISSLYGISILSSVFFLSAVMKRSITAILTGILSFFMVLPIVGKVLEGIEVEPWFLVTYSGGLITDVLNVSEDTGFGPGHHMASTVFEPDLMVGMVVMVIYTILFFGMGLFTGARRRME